jgi:hypothetical protein
MAEPAFTPSRTPGSRAGACAKASVAANKKAMQPRRNQAGLVRIMRKDHFKLKPEQEIRNPAVYNRFAK